MENSTDRESLEERIRTAINSAAIHPQLDEQDAEWATGYLSSIASVLSIADETEDFKEFYKSQFAKETSDYDQEELKWIRYKQSRSKTIDEIVKRKDELARSIKEGKIDIDRVIHSAAHGDIDSLITIIPYFQFGFQSYQPSRWEKFIIFLLRRKVDTHPS